MPDRLQDIRARLDKCQRRKVLSPQYPADIAYLLRRLDFETRLAADLEAQLNRVHERHAAEVERLRTENGTELLGNTNLSVGNGLCDADDSVVQGVTKWQGD